MESHSLELVVKGNTGKDITTSLIIAKIFGKAHDKVCRDIENLECSPEFNNANFGEIEYLDARGRYQPAYEITKDGFSFLVMGYTGSKAAEWKEKFIGEFNRREALLKDDDFILQRALSILTERTKQLQLDQDRTQHQLEEQNEVIAIQAPKVQYHDEVLQSSSLIPSNIIAKELGMSAIGMNTLLIQAKILYRQGDTLVLYRKYQDKGYTGTRTFTYHDTFGVERSKIHTYWTEKGRQFLHDFFKSN